MLRYILDGAWWFLGVASRQIKSDDLVFRDCSVQSQQQRSSGHKEECGTLGKLSVISLCPKRGGERGAESRTNLNLI